MELTDKVKIVFSNNSGDKAEIEISINQLIENTIDDFHDMLDNSAPCTSSGCNNESQNFCDCGSIFDEYEITGIDFIKN